MKQSVPFLLLLLMLSFVACRPKRPAGIIGESTMAKVLYDYHLAQGMADANAVNSGVSSSELFATYRQAVFDKYGITAEIFDSSMNFYASDLVILNDIYVKVQKRMDEDARLWANVASLSQDIFANLSVFGDTANVWTGNGVYVLKNQPAENFQTWSLACDSTWLPGDDILWRFDARLLSSQRMTAYADLVVTYTNDSVRSYHASMAPQDKAEFRVRNTKFWTPRRISGHLYAPIESDVKKRCFYIIYGIDLIRIHKQDRPKPTDIHTADTLQSDTLQSDSLITDTITHNP